MRCRKCGKSIPDSAKKCPYCYTRTAEGWKKEGEKLIAPVKELFKNPFKK
ncbi:MAG: zinc-ribbon domain-containing protein [Solobacterium sp.]|jgi:uncharacterized OB-fold protein|nr:zinc-ribbon domain-containing protein [Solobacterium sp.]